MKKSGLKMYFEGSTIIYCPTKKQTEAVAQELKCMHFYNYYRFILKYYIFF